VAVQQGNIAHVAERVPSISAVAVFGSSQADQAAYAQAEAVGRVLGRQGYTVVNGGYGGTMEASAKGARAVGAEAIGVTCRAWSSMPNSHLTRQVETANLLQRLATLIELATSGFVVLPGGTGTLVEFATVWELINKQLTATRPVVCVGDFWAPLVELISHIQPPARRRVEFAADAEALVEFFPPLSP